MAANDLGPEPSASAFVGRQGELQATLGLLAAARAGRGGLVLVTGEAGVGKTRLAVEVAGHADDAGVAVGWGYGRAEFATPLGLWHEALARLGCRSIDDLMPAATDRVDRLLAAVGEELEALTVSTPVLLVLEDLHWADELTHRQLAWIRPRLPTLRMLILATSRTPMPDLGRPDVHLALDGLTESEVAVLLGATSVEPVDAGELWRRTRGNPLFVLEAARRGSSGVPATVRDVVQQRVATLDAGVRTVLGAAAVLGESFSRRPLEELVPELDVGIAIDTAVHEGLLEEAAGGRLLRFHHDVVREAVYEATAPRERRGHHARAARALAADGAGAAEVARHHVLAGGESDVEDLAEWAERAGHHAAGFCDHAGAADWFETAVTALPETHPRSLELRLLAAASWSRAGHRDRAWATYERVAAEAEATGKTDALAWAALGFGGGRAGFEVPPLHEGQRRLLSRALDAIGPGDHMVRALLLSRLSITLSFEYEPERQRDLANAAVGAARQSGDAAALVTALSSWCDAHGGPDHVRDRLAVADEMVATAGAIEDLELELLGLRFRIVALLELGDRLAAERAVRRFAKLAAVLRQPGISFYIPLFGAMFALVDGRFDEAERANAEAAALGEAAQSENAHMLTMSQLFAIRLQQGRAADLLDDLRAITDQYPDITGPQGGMALTEAQLGRHHEAVARLERLRAGGFHTFPVDAEWLSSLSTVAEAAILTRHRPSAEDLLPLLLPYGGLFVIDGIGAAVLTTVSLCAARLAVVVGDGPTAGALFPEAMAECRSFGGALLTARVAEAWATCVHDDDPSLARDLRAEAAALRGTPVSSSSAPEPPTGPRGGSGEAVHAAFRREGDVWALWWGDERALLRDMKGLQYLRQMVARPNRPLHVLELTGRTSGASDTGPRVDEQGLRAYRDRLEGLRRELEEAKANGAVGRAESLEREQDALVAELRGAVGLGGRARREGSEAERARVNVAKSVRQALDRIEQQLPALGYHLRTTVRTGTFCSYEPDPRTPPDWELG